jgi:hypothetical protein
MTEPTVKMSKACTVLEPGPVVLVTTHAAWPEEQAP